MNTNLSIVTAFFDIGRGNWTVNEGFPHYIKRSREVYLERFELLQQLHTDITVFTSSDLVDEVKKTVRYKSEPVNIVVVDLKKKFGGMRDNIAKIQQLEEFQNRINHNQKSNPEYRVPEYVLVTNLKAFFANKACELNLPKQDMVAWIDFGYCRKLDDLPSTLEWNYDFDTKKIHLFSYKEIDKNRPIDDVIFNNDVYILGAKVVASKQMWPIIKNLMDECHSDLAKNNLVDDDQGLWLMSYLKKPDVFTLHTIPDHQLGHYPFVLFKQFNNAR